MKLQKFNLKEVVADEYLCPECGAQMSSGIQAPTGDYDDWMVEPHCTKCDFETRGGKNPFEECVPTEHPEPYSYVLLEYWRPPVFPGDVERREYKVLLCKVSELDMEHKLSHWGFGGTMYQNHSFTPAQFACAYQAGETEDSFRKRAYEEAKAHKESIQ